MKVFTNSRLRQPIVCGSVGPRPDFLGRPGFGDSLSTPMATAKLSGNSGRQEKKSWFFLFFFLMHGSVRLGTLWGERALCGADVQACVCVCVC